MSAFIYRGMTIPEHMMRGLRRYIDDGVAPGGFLRAVLANDLTEAVARADADNLRILPAFVAYLINEAPSACWGSPAKVNRWVALAQMQGSVA